jgi:PPP family 3-phenylpropionic acid transporter
MLGIARPHLLPGRADAESTLVPAFRQLSPAARGSLYYFAYWGAVAVYVPFINVHFAQLGLSGTQIGLLNAIMPLVTLTLGPALAALGDRRGIRVRILTLALALLALALLLLTFPRSFVALAPLMIMLALGRSPVGPIGDSLVARMAVRHRVDFGAMRLWGSLGFALIAIGIGALWQRIGYIWMFPLGAALLVPVVLAASQLEEGPVIERGARKPFRDVTRDRGLMVILAATFLIGGSLGMDGAFQGIYVNYIGGGGFLVGALFGVSAFSELPAMRFATALARRLGPAGTLLLAYGLLEVNYIGFALATTPLVLVPLTMLKGVGFGLYFANTVRLIDERTPPEWASTIQAVMNAGAAGLAPLVASLLGGALIDLFGPRAIYQTCIIVVAVAMLTLGGAAALGVFRAPPLQSGEPR